MRSPVRLLATALVVALTTACVTVVPGPVPARTRVPAPPPPEPLELSIAHPIQGELPVQTSRASYVAIFEIVPGRGVSIVYPSSANDPSLVLSGLNWVPVWWTAQRWAYANGRGTERQTRYIYAVASERPLYIGGESFETGYFRRALGMRTYLADDPYETMRAVAQLVVPPQRDESWAEDEYVLLPDTRSIRTARIYCPGGRVYTVPEDFASRAWCPTRTRVVVLNGRRSTIDDVSAPQTPTRPDSAIGQGNGRTTTRVIIVRGRGPVDRVKRPGAPTPGPVATQPTPTRPGTPVTPTRPGNAKPDVVAPGNDRGDDNGNHYGQDKNDKPDAGDKARGNGNDRSRRDEAASRQDDERGRDRARNDESRGNGAAQGQLPRRVPPGLERRNVESTGGDNAGGQDAGRGNGQADAGRGNGGDQSRGNPRDEERAQPPGQVKQEERAAPREEPREQPRQEPREERRPEPRPEVRPEVRPEPRPEPREEPRPEPPKQEPRNDPRPEPEARSEPREERRGDPPSESRGEPAKSEEKSSEEGEEKPAAGEQRGPDRGKPARGKKPSV
jgi:hypothetical protein